MKRTEVRFMMGARCEEPFLSHLVLVSKETESPYCCKFICRLEEGEDPFIETNPCLHGNGLDYLYEIPYDLVDISTEGCPACPKCLELRNKYEHLITEKNDYKKIRQQFLLVIKHGSEIKYSEDSLSYKLPQTEIAEKDDNGNWRLLSFMRRELSNEFVELAVPLPREAFYMDWLWRGKCLCGCTVCHNAWDIKV